MRAFLTAVLWLDVWPAVAIAASLTGMIAFLRLGLGHQLDGVTSEGRSQVWAEITFPAAGTLSLVVGWAVLGDKRYARRGYTTRAIRSMVRLGFTQLGLRSMHSWLVEDNVASIRMIERLGFRFTGRQRQCHVIDGRWCDRLLLDVLASEFEDD